MRIIFSNLTEKKECPGLQLLPLGKWTISRVFPVGQRGWVDLYWQPDKKSTRKTTLFLWNRFWLHNCPHVKKNTCVCVHVCLLAFKIHQACSRGFDIEMMLCSDTCSLFSTCHSHPGLHCPTKALDAHNMTKQTSYCCIKLWQHRNTRVFAHLLWHTNMCFLRLLQFQPTNKEIMYWEVWFPDPWLPSEQIKCIMFHNISTVWLGNSHC